MSNEIVFGLVINQLMSNEIVFGLVINQLISNEIVFGLTVIFVMCQMKLFF